MTKMNNERAIFYLEDYVATYKYRLSAEVQEVYRMAIDALQERPKGRWDKGECTNCGHYVGGIMTDYFDYCPRCGSDNRGESND